MLKIDRMSTPPNPAITLPIPPARETPSMIEAATTSDVDITEPTERSRPPEIITMVWPSETTPNIEDVRATLNRLLSLKKNIVIPIVELKETFKEYKG